MCWEGAFWWQLGTPKESGMAFGHRHGPDRPEHHQLVGRFSGGCRCCGGGAERGRLPATWVGKAAPSPGRPVFSGSAAHQGPDRERYGICSQLGSMIFSTCRVYVHHLR